MDDSDLSTETEWIRRCQGGDKEAFGLLVTRYMKQGYYAALSFLGSHEDALDASQEAFAKAFNAIGTFQPGKRFYTWYYRILKNHCLNTLRSKKRVPVSVSTLLEEGREVMADEPQSDSVIEREELRRAVWDALWKLDPEDRELLVARDMLRTSYAMLAELLDCPVGTVMSRLYYARRKLRAHLGKEWQ